MLATRSKGAAALASSSPNSLIASAARVGKGGVSWSKIARTRSDAWQTAAWNFYRTIGEYRFACDWVGAMLSKATLHATVEEDGKPRNLTEGPAVEYLHGLFGDSDGRAEMLRLIGIHMTVAGECWIVGYPKVEETDDGIIITEEDHWEVVAATSLKNTGGKKTPRWSINGATLDTDDHNDVMVIRIWLPDPVDSDLAISPSRAILSTLGELHKLSEHVSAQVDSRLAGAGLLLVPSEMQFPKKIDIEADSGEVKTANNAQDLMDLLQTAMETAIEDRGDPSAIVPIVITAPADAIQHVKHLTFWSGLDEKAIELRSEAIRRLALGMDMPPEVLQGVGESNHWNAWQADESGIKAHTEPLLKVVTTAIAKGFLRPLLAANPKMVRAGAHIPSFSVKADTSELRLRPNRSKEAMELWALNLISDKALLREVGFDYDNDLPSEEERQAWFMKKVASGSTTPQQVEKALTVLFPQLDFKTMEEGTEEVGDEARPEPSLKDHPVRDIPDQEISIRRKQAREEGRVPSAASLLACEQIVLRALERAGNRMRNKVGGKMSGIAASDTYLTFAAKSDDISYYLDDAFGGNVAVLAEHMQVEKEWLESTLDGYCRVLLMSQKPHQFSTLENHFALTPERKSVSV